MQHNPHFQSHLLGDRILLSDLDDLSDRELEILYAEVASSKDEATDAWHRSRTDGNEGNKAVWQVMKYTGVFKAAIENLQSRRARIDGFQLLRDELNSVREERDNLRLQLDHLLGASK